jgi:hypothetical protein
LMPQHSISSFFSHEGDGSERIAVFNHSTLSGSMGLINCLYPTEINKN